MSKDKGMAVRKSIAVPCLVAFWGDSIPTCSFIFLNVFPVVVFRGEKSVDSCVDDI